MNKKLFAIVWIEAVIAFLIPTLSGIASAFALSGHTLAAGILSAFVAGLSGLKSFMSTTVSDAKDDLAAPISSVLAHDAGPPIPTGSATKPSN